MRTVHPSSSCDGQTQHDMAIATARASLTSMECYTLPIVFSRGAGGMPTLSSICPPARAFSLRFASNALPLKGTDGRKLARSNDEAFVAVAVVRRGSTAVTKLRCEAVASSTCRLSTVRVTEGTSAYV